MRSVGTCKNRCRDQTSSKGQEIKVLRPGLRAPPAGSPPVSALAAAARWSRKRSFFLFAFFCFLLNFFPFDDIGSAISPLSSDLLRACEKA